MVKKMKKMEEKLVHGKQAEIMAAEQKKAIRKQKNELDEVLRREAELETRIEEEENDLEQIRKKFSNVQEEYEYKTEKL